MFAIISFSVNAQNAQDIFLENLTAFENLKNESQSIDLNTVYEARQFLIEVTGISYEMEKPFEMPIFPSDKTLIDWRNWYEKNKAKLYWDENDQKVKVKEE
ncbi:hypothetical protein HYN48_14050 [Flavobacterium magnum]|uniref:Uncharacterized protein n=1 Tax=Flavobacterium magnum TaxID=2162713 RepID=A0A2S0RK75_9FLAO|nr:hypothetical protein HYN48_14050 [Flavobacterium magnum]